MEDTLGGRYTRWGGMQKAMTLCEGLEVRRSFCRHRDVVTAAQCGRVSMPAEKIEQGSGLDCKAPSHGENFGL